uniref:ubiquitinyl hydrolase 1 n=1 Tax=Mycena chlorophos TaxID=658473 RepID=A0ABQ0LMV8_MYCCL|nr:predicted protein [Mycena chlorophos]
MTADGAPSPGATKQSSGNAATSGGRETNASVEESQAEDSDSEDQDMPDPDDPDGVFKRFRNPPGPLLRAKLLEMPEEQRDREIGLIWFNSAYENQREENIIRNAKLLASLNIPSATWAGTGSLKRKGEENAGRKKKKAKPDEELSLEGSDKQEPAEPVPARTTRSKNKSSSAANPASSPSAQNGASQVKKPGNGPKPPKKPVTSNGEWARRATQKFLRLPFEDGNWDGLVEKWMEWEKICGFVISTESHSTKDRPTEVHWWVGRGRRLKPTVDDAATFATEWRAWWTNLSPKQGNDDEMKDWTRLNVPGQNGMLNVLGCLVWWAEAENKSGERSAEWARAVKDVSWALDGMMAWKTAEMAVGGSESAGGSQPGVSELSVAEEAGSKGKEKAGSSMEELYGVQVAIDVPPRSTVADIHHRLFSHHIPVVRAFARAGSLFSLGDQPSALDPQTVSSYAVRLEVNLNTLGQSQQPPLKEELQDIAGNKGPSRSCRSSHATTKAQPNAISAELVNVAIRGVDIMLRVPKDSTVAHVQTLLNADPRPVVRAYARAGRLFSIGRFAVPLLPETTLETLNFEMDLRVLCYGGVQLCAERWTRMLSQSEVLSRVVSGQRVMWSVAAQKATLRELLDYLAPDKNTHETAARKEFFSKCARVFASAGRSTASAIISVDDSSDVEMDAAEAIPDVILLSNSSSDIEMVVDAAPATMIVLPLPDNQGTEEAEGISNGTLRPCDALSPSQAEALSKDLDDTALFTIPACLDGILAHVSCNRPGCCTCMVKGVIHQMQESDGRPIRPSQLWADWAVVFWNNDILHDSIEKIRQEDAHEFLKGLIDLIHNENTTSTLLLVVSKSTFRDSFIRRVFAGQTLSTIHCPCGYQSLGSPEEFHNLCLPIKDAEKKFSRVKDSLLCYFISETLDGDNKYNCPSCAEAVNANKKQISDTPEILVLSLNRFTNTNSKIMHQVVAPLALDVAPFVISGNSSTYSLCATVNHSGSSAHHGHYVAAVKRGDEWMECNDTQVSPCSSQEVSHNKGAYLLFYARNIEGLETPEDDAQSEHDLSYDPSVGKSENGNEVSVQHQPRAIEDNFKAQKEEQSKIFYKLPPQAYLLAANRRPTPHCHYEPENLLPKAATIHKVSGSQSVWTQSSHHLQLLLLNMANPKLQDTQSIPHLRIHLSSTFPLFDIPIPKRLQPLFDLFIPLFRQWRLELPVLELIKIFDTLLEDGRWSMSQFIQQPLATLAAFAEAHPELQSLAGIIYLREFSAPLALVPKIDAAIRAHSQFTEAFAAAQTSIVACAETTPDGRARWGYGGQFKGKMKDWSRWDSGLLLIHVEVFERFKHKGAQLRSLVVASQEDRTPIEVDTWEHVVQGLLRPERSINWYFMAIGCRFDFGKELKELPRAVLKPEEICYIGDGPGPTHTGSRILHNNTIQQLVHEASYAFKTGPESAETISLIDLKYYHGGSNSRTRIKVGECQVQVTAMQRHQVGIVLGCNPAEALVDLCVLIKANNNKLLEHNDLFPGSRISAKWVSTQKPFLLICRYAPGYGAHLQRMADIHVELSQSGYGALIHAREHLYQHETSSHSKQVASKYFDSLPQKAAKLNQAYLEDLWHDDLDALHQILKIAMEKIPLFLSVAHHFCPRPPGAGALTTAVDRRTQNDAGKTCSALRCRHAVLGQELSATIALYDSHRCDSRREVIRPVTVGERVAWAATETHCVVLDEKDEVRVRVLWEEMSKLASSQAFTFGSLVYKKCPVEVINYFNSELQMSFDQIVQHRHQDDFNNVLDFINQHFSHLNLTISQICSSWRDATPTGRIFTLASNIQAKKNGLRWVRSLHSVGSKDVVLSVGGNQGDRVLPPSELLRLEMTASDFRLLNKSSVEQWSESVDVAWATRGVHGSISTDYVLALAILLKIVDYRCLPAPHPEAEMMFQSISEARLGDEYKKILALVLKKLPDFRIDLVGNHWRHVGDEDSVQLNPNTWAGLQVSTGSVKFVVCGRPKTQAFSSGHNKLGIARNNLKERVRPRIMGEKIAMEKQSGGIAWSQLAVGAWRGDHNICYLVAIGLLLGLLDSTRLV